MYKMTKFAYLISDSTLIPACIWIPDYFFLFLYLQKVYEEGYYVIQWF